VGGCEHQIARQRGAGAEIVARVDNHHNRPRRPSNGRRRITGNGQSGCADHQANNDGKNA
jgi:hypothetical protein